MTDPNWIAKAQPWLPPGYSEADIWAVRAFAQGKATESQQLRVWSYFMYLTNASEEFADLSFRPGEDGRRATDFAEGKRFPGLMLRKLLRPELTPRGEHEVDVPTLPKQVARPRKPRKKK